MNIKRNGKTINKIDRRTNKFWCKGYNGSPKPRKRLRTQPKGNQRGIKVLFACSLIPMIALFCTGFKETKQAMNEKHEVIEQVEDLPPSTKLETLSVVKPITEHAEAKESIEDMIKRIFPEDWQLATAIFKAESGLRPDAKGDTNTPYPSIGIAQIRMLPERGLNEQDLYDPEYNLEYARQLKDASGWFPWSAYKNGSYKKYIN